MVYWLGPKKLAPYNVDVQYLDGDPQKIEVVDPHQDDGRYFRSGLSALTSGRAIKPEWVPEKMEWRAPQQYIPDFEKIYGLLSVSEAFKQVVERVEPSVHQFFPVEYIDKHGQHLQHRWFMNVCNRIDSTDHEATSATGYVLHRGRCWTDPRTAAPEEEKHKWKGAKLNLQLIFDLSKIGDRHLWIDKYDMYGRPIVSDELAEALNGANLNGVVLARGETV